MINFRSVCNIYDGMQKYLKKQNNELILHYTSTEVLDNVLSNATFRASHILYLNDSDEYHKGLDTIKNSIHDLEHINTDLPDLFVISFSKEKDLLSQWTTYAKESGVAIEFDYKLLTLPSVEKKPRFVFGIEDDGRYNCKEKDEKKYSNIVFNTTSVVQNVKYVSEKKQSELKKLLRECYLQTCETDSSGMSLYAAYLKNSSFSAEKEIRAAFIYHKYETENKNEVLHPKINYYRMPKGILRPYINVKFLYCRDEEGRDGEYTYEPMLPIKSITVGPSGNQQSVFDSIVHRLEFGECKLFDYSKNNIMNRKILDDFWNEVDEWLSKNKKIDDSFKNDIKQAVLNNKECTSSTGCEDVNRIVEEIGKNFHLSKYGILIRKSKIPYIF